VLGAAAAEDEEDDAAALAEELFEADAELLALFELLRPVVLAELDFVLEALLEPVVEAEDEPLVDALADLEEIEMLALADAEALLLPVVRTPVPPAIAPTAQ